MSASVAPVRGAVAYAWYVGTTAGTERLAAITTINSVVVGALNGSGWIPAAQRCAGNVGVRFYNGRRQVAFVVAPVAGNCRFGVTARKALDPVKPQR